MGNSEKNNNRKIKEESKMKLIRYRNPELSSIYDWDRWFDDAFTSIGLGGSLFDGAGIGGRAFRPAANISEENEEYIVRIELPGVKKGAVEVELSDATVTVKGDRKEKGGDGEQSLSFRRSVRVPNEVDTERVKAKLKDGILTVTLPKAESSKPKLIAVS